MKTQKPLLLFLGVTFGLSLMFYIAIAILGENGMGLTALLMWCPALGAFAANRICYPKQKLLGFRGCGLPAILVSILLPLVYFGVSYAIYWIAFDKPDFSQNFYLSNPLILLLSIPGSFVTALGEEIGWRGFFAPELRKFLSFRRTVLLSGLVWSIWHFPLFVFGGYMAGAPLWYQLPVFTVEILGISLAMTWLREKSGSVWPAVLLHTFHNYFDQLIFSPSTVGARAPYLIGETGVISMVCLVAAAFLATKIPYGTKSKETGR